MKKPKTEWVDCPICGGTEMRCEYDEDAPEHRIISCVNLCCASNGGSNADMLLESLKPNLKPVDKTQLPFRKDLPINKNLSIWIWHNADFTETWFELVSKSDPVTGPGYTRYNGQVIAGFSNPNEFFAYLSRWDIVQLY